MGTDNASYNDFLHFSSVLTGFSTFDLKGTGQSEVYLGTVRDVIGETRLAELLNVFRTIVDESGDDEESLSRALRREVLSDDELGPVARNIIKLWYVGIWYELPKPWQERYGTSEKDRNHVISPDTYQEGLLWPAIGANPSGAKPFGYGTWANPPHLGTSFEMD